MKTTVAHNRREIEIIDQALEALRLQTGLTARIVRTHPRLDEFVPDATIEITARGKRLTFVAEAKLIDRFNAIAQVRAMRPPDRRPPLLLIAPYITAEASERCRQLRLFFLDTAGNAYIDVPGLYLFIVGRKRLNDVPLADRGRMKNPAALKVIFAILCRPDLIRATYREIAGTARVALGIVGPILKDLEARGQLVNIGEAPQERRLLDPERLLREWVDFYPAVLRPKLNTLRFRAQYLTWAEEVNVRMYEAYWGGEVAAHRLTGYLKPARATIYVRHKPTKLIAEGRLRADINGDVEILDIFWNPDQIPHRPDLVPDILTYADLMTTTEGRNLETARLIYDQNIAPHLRPTSE